MPISHGKLMDWLLGSRTIVSSESIQPNKAKVPVVVHGEQFRVRQQGYDTHESIGANGNYYFAMPAGATRSDAFITISGTPPTAPVIGQISPILGSNAPEGGNC